jgi:hydroxymethylglutaryl-CoA lyase
VGPRDGLQNSQAAMPTGARLRWTAVMAAAGIPDTYQPARAAA